MEIVGQDPHNEDSTEGAPNKFLNPQALNPV